MMFEFILKCAENLANLQYTIPGFLLHRKSVGYWASKNLGIGVGVGHNDGINLVDRMECGCVGGMYGINPVDRMECGCVGGMYGINPVD
ncbi:hypothetical protein BSK67_08300 [Paenibacillus odorifer]|nr:hypothetical protein BSK67_08300 [Paenibacillus odorifer]